jgi:hypothetical protein
MDSMSVRFDGLMYWTSWLTKTTSINKNNYCVRLQETEHARVHLRICRVIIYAAQAIR